MKTGKLLLKGNIRLLSPALIGSGTDESTDMDLIRDSEGKPYIPATSFIGVLRSKFYHLQHQDFYRELYQYFWGFTEDKNAQQSAIYCKDLYTLDEVSIAIRDGIAIDNSKGTAKERAKFNYEVIEPNCLFNLEMEVDLIEGYEKDFKNLVGNIVELLKSGDLRIGAKTRNGLGRIQLENEQIYEFDFKKSEHIVKWLKGELPEPLKLDIEPLLVSPKTFTISAEFLIKNSLIVRSYTGDPLEPDAVHISSVNKPILPGSSIKGAIKARAERILNTLGKSSKLINELFGYVDETKNLARRGKVLIEETILPDYPSEVQTRIKIDRLTGGVIGSALLETMPLFNSKKERPFKIEIRISDYKPHEAGLMLLILKDLWTGDLPIGGEKSIGRGVLKGKKAEIHFDGKKITIENPATDLKGESGQELQNFVNQLLNYKEVNNAASG
ncbi:MAG: RAMP superfamily CRISPR-associated protein [Thermodesulfovibrionales bacterium]